MCVTFGLLLGLLFTPGAQQGAQYFVAAGRANVSQGVSSVLAISLAGGGTAALLAIPLIHSDIGFFRQARTDSFYLALILVPLTALSEGLKHQLAALRRFARLAAVRVLQIAANVLAIVVLVLGCDLGVDGALLALAGAQSFAVAACLLDLRHYCGLRVELPCRLVLPGIIGYGLRYHAARIGETLDQRVGVLVLGFIATQAEIGLFSAACALMLGFKLLSEPVGSVTFPRIVARERPETVALALRLVCALTGAAMLAVLVGAEFLVGVLLDDSFRPAVPMLWILAPGILAATAAGMFITHFKGANRPNICSWAVCFGLSVNFGALPFLYPLFGAEAAAWALTAGMICRCAFLAVAFRHKTRMPWLSIWLPRRGDVVFAWQAARSVLAGRNVAA